MSEFNNRIGAQRDVLSIVNSYYWREELFGLAGKTIERWIMANQLDSSADLVVLVREAGAKLFFLANKSQEQITSDYRALSGEVELILQKIHLAMQLLKNDD